MNAPQTLNSISITLDTRRIITEGTITRGVEGPKLKPPPLQLTLLLIFSYFGWRFIP